MDLDDDLLVALGLRNGTIRTVNVGREANCKHTWLQKNFRFLLRGIRFIKSNIMGVELIVDDFGVRMQLVETEPFLPAH